MPPDGLPQVWGAFGALTFLPLHAPSKSHATLPIDYRYLIAYEINTQGWKNRLGLEGVGGGVHFKTCYRQGGYNFHM